MATISSLTHLFAFLLGLVLASLTTETRGYLQSWLGGRKKLHASDSKDTSRSRNLSATTVPVTPPDSHTGEDVILSRYLLAESLLLTWLTTPSDIRSRQRMHQRHGSARLTIHSFALCWKKHPYSPVSTQPKATKPTNSDSSFSKVRISRYHPTSPPSHPRLSPTCPDLAN